MFKNLSADKKEFAYFIIIMFALAWFAMKLSLPVLPRLIHIFATTPAIIKLSVALFFASYAASQLFWGAASETYGRRLIILYGFLLACCGTIIVIFSTDVWVYITGRCLEGAGLGVSSPSARAMLADRFDRIEIAHILTICSAICGITPAVAPIIGGFIAVALGWRWVFIFFLILLILFFFWCLKALNETYSEAHKNQTITDSLQQYLLIIRSKYFWAYTSCYALTQGTLLGYYGAMPFWYVQQWHIPEQYYAFLALFNVVAYVSALAMTRYLVNYWRLTTLIRCGILLGSVTVVIALFFSIYNAHSWVPIVIIMTLMALSSGIIFPSANAAGLSYFKKQAGPYSALTSSSMFLMAAIFSYIESHLLVIHLWPLSLFLAVLNIIVWTLQIVTATRSG